MHTEAKLSDLNINCSDSHFCLNIRQIFFNDVIFKAAITYFFLVQIRGDLIAAGFLIFAPAVGGRLFYHVFCSLNNKSYSCSILIHLLKK